MPSLARLDFPEQYHRMLCKADGIGHGENRTVPPVRAFIRTTFSVHCGFQEGCCAEFERSAEVMQSAARIHLASNVGSGRSRERS